VHVVTQAAKALVARYYGKAPRYSYFSGCSDGGREGVVAAMRYPTDFDGIIAGAPVVNTAMNNSLFHAWLVRHLSRRDGSLVFSDAVLRRLYDAQLKACPLTAGGVIADPRDCRLDLSTVGLTDEQVAAAKAIYSGPLDEQGKALYFGAPQGSELTWNQQLPASRAFAASFISYVASSPPLKALDFWTVKFDRKSAAAYTRVSSVIGAVDPDLSAFRKAGGKLILWHGWGDVGVPAGSTVALHHGLRQRLGAGSRDMLRLYMLPGVYHCGNGPGPDRVDLLSPMMAWVEQGLPPGIVMATSHNGAAAAGIDPK
jgi:feruloyl esterase